MSNIHILRLDQAVQASERCSRWPLAHADEMQPARAVCKSKHIRRISKPLPRAHAFFLRSRRPRPPALPLARIMHAVKVEPHMPETTHRRPRCFATSESDCLRACAEEKRYLALKETVAPSSVAGSAGPHGGFRASDTRTRGRMHERRCTTSFLSEPFLS